MKLAEFRENPDNPSKATEEQLERLAGKLKRVPLGLTAMRIAYVTDDQGGGRMVISGNKRLRVLKKAYGDDADLPDEWFQDVTAMSPAERHEFIVAANVSDGSWDLDRLMEQYGRNELEDLMGTKAVAKLLDNLKHSRTREKRDAKTASDGTAAVDEPDSRPGAVYALGRHRLICGDCTDKAVLDRLMRGQKADPPYNINVKGATADALTIKNDNMAADDFQDFMDRTAASMEYALKPGGCFYVWRGHEPYVHNALLKAGLHEASELIWVKNQASFNMGRTDYAQRHENCSYGWKTGAQHYFSGYGRTTVDDKEVEDKSEWVRSGDVIWRDKPTRCGLHPTMKPVELIQDNVECGSREGETVLDLFCGSGTTVIACERSGRRCYGVELDPKYCDVIRKRWAEEVRGEGCDWKTETPEEPDGRG